jgi:multisubunit Na+/H+ antiporter MnhB subunit
LQGVLEVLNHYAALTCAWRPIVWAVAAYLVALGLVCLLRPAIAARFLDGHAASARLNLVEAVARLIAGLGFMGASVGMKAPELAFGFGVVLFVSAVAMAFLYRVHQRYAGWAVPFAKRNLPALGLFALGFGGMIAWMMT